VMVDHALAIAGRGHPVLILHEPAGTTGQCSCRREDCDSPAKHPRTEHGLKDATVDAETIRRWWTRWPTANIGVRTGLAFDVLDIDPIGLDTLSELAGGDDAIIPCGPVVRTPRGGAHIYFQPSGIGNKVGFRPGLDWRGKNGYVVVPPSVGANRVAYEWHAA
jgi:hypothetical protein